MNNNQIKNKKIILKNDYIVPKNINLSRTFTNEEILEIQKLIKKQENEQMKMFQNNLKKYEELLEKERKNINKYFEKNRPLEEIMSRSFLYLLKAKILTFAKKRKEIK